MIETHANNMDHITFNNNNINWTAQEQKEEDRKWINKAMVST